MTKAVRIENADTSSFKVVVEVWDKGGISPEGSVLPDRLADTVRLDYPTAMTNNVYITSTRYLVIKEAE